VRVGAWFKVDVQGSVSSLVTGRGERFFLGVWLPWTSMEALSDQAAIGVENDSAHHRVRAGPEVTLTREFDGACGPMQVYARIRFCFRQTLGNIRATP